MTSYDVLIDVDDVIYPWSATAHTVCQRAGITNGKEITQWAFYNDYGCTSAVLWDVLGEATKTGELYQAAPYPGVLAQLRRLQYAGHRVHIVTARGFGPLGEMVQGLTREWIARENVPFDTIAFAKDKRTTGEYHFAIDDGVHNYIDLSEAGVLVSLMHQRHNQDFVLHNGLPVRRVDSVRTFVNQIMAAQAAEVEAAA